MKDIDSQDRYTLSFTNGGLFKREADSVIPVYLRERDWGVVRQNVQDGNLLLARTETSNSRVAREVIQRLRVLTDAELELYPDLSPTERAHLMWIAACRRYALIGEFAEEVLRERYLLLTPTLDMENYDRFISARSLWHSELEELKETTYKKLRQVLFRMMREAGLLSESGAIIPIFLSTRLHELLASRSPSEVRFFPTDLPMTVSPL